MNRTITIIVDDKMKLQFVVGGYDLDEAGLAFTSDVLRTTTTLVEKALIRKQIEQEAMPQEEDKNSEKQEQGSE